MQIETLSDQQAIEILSLVASAQARRADTATDLTPDLDSSLGAELRISPSPSGDADLAREALQLLAEDPETAKAIEALAKSDRPQRFLGGPEIAVATAALIALQTRIKIQRDKKGRWQFELDKKAASDGLLKSLASKILGKLTS